MTLTAVSNVLWPFNITGVAALIATGSTATSVDASGEYFSFNFTAIEDMSISHVGVWVDAPVAPTANVRIEPLTSDGYPTGALWGSSTNIVSALSSGWNLLALTAAATIATGQTVGVKFAHNSSAFTVKAVTNSMDTTNMPFIARNSGSSAIGSVTCMNALCVGNSSVNFYKVYGAIPSTAVETAAFTNTSSFPTRGVRFQVPFSCECAGMRIMMGFGATFTIGIYDDSGAELGNSETTVRHPVLTAVGMFYFDNKVTLSPGTWYRAAITAASTNNHNWQCITIPSCEYRTALLPGENWYDTRSSGSGWTDFPTRIPYTDLILSKLDTGTGGGTAYVVGG